MIKTADVAEALREVPGQVFLDWKPWAWYSLCLKLAGTDRPRPDGKLYCIRGTAEKIDSSDYKIQVNRIPRKRDPGGMAEWFKAAVLKTVSRRRDVGSNPTPSARLLFE
jgi:hypothetical protein